MKPLCNILFFLVKNIANTEYLLHVDVDKQTCKFNMNLVCIYAINKFNHDIRFKI